jgi:hypothetical protein
VIDRQKGGFIQVECDSCDEVLDTKTRDFDDARAMMKREGWFTRRIADVWLHGCGKCGVPT